MTMHDPSPGAGVPYPESLSATCAHLVAQFCDNEALEGSRVVEVVFFEAVCSLSIAHRSTLPHVVRTGTTILHLH